MTSLEDSPNRPGNAARPSATGKQQAADNLNSKIANEELSLQQQHVDCTEDPGSSNYSADTEDETRDIQFLNNTFKPFSSSGKQLLHAEEVQKCILYLQHTYYNQAKHLSPVGLTHEAGGTCEMQTNFSKAGSTEPLVSCAEISQTFRDSLQRSGPSPVVVFSDNSHFQVVLMNAVPKTVTLFDPFGKGFPTPVRDTVKTFFDRDSSRSWTYRTWKQKLQTDTWNCGIWAIWVTERWMQYWTEEDGKQPFDCWLKRHTCPVPNIQKLRQQYHDMISAALVISSDGQSEMDRIDRTLAKMWADAAQRTEPNDAGNAIDLNSADTSTAHDTQAPPANTKGQRTNTEVKLGCKAAQPAKHAAEQPTLHAKRRQTRLRSNRTTSNLSTRGHQGKRHQSTVKTNSSTHESQERPNIKSDGINSTEQEHSGTQKQQHARPTIKRTMLDFLQPSSNKIETAAFTGANTADTCAQKMKRKICEPEPQLAQSSRNEQATPTQNLAGKRQKAKGTFSDKCEEVRVMTWNVMGTTTVLDELQNLGQKHKPCIMVLTETKLTQLEQDRKMLNTCLPDYKLYHSRVKGHKTGKQRTGSAGVTIAVHTSLTTQNSVQLIHLDHPAAKGHCKCLKIQPPVWGVYVPCTDMHTRKEVYNLLQTEMQTQDKIALEAGSSKPCHILAGDMNAALYMDDRQTSVHPEDAMHQELMQTLKMHTTDKHQGMPRSRSYHRHGHNCKSSEDSRIDDISVSQNLCCHKIPVTTIADTTGDSDHSPIYATIPLTSMSFTRPGPDPTPLPREPRLKTPVPAGALQQYTEAIDLELGAAIAMLNAELDSSLETALQQVNPQNLTATSKHIWHMLALMKASLKHTATLCKTYLSSYTQLPRAYCHTQQAAM